jgi:hypothetical protein
MVSDLDAAESLVLALGGKLLDGSDKPIGYRVYADPIGHPFCLVTPESIVSDPSEVHPAQADRNKAGSDLGNRPSS